MYYHYVDLFLNIKNQYNVIQNLAVLLSKTSWWRFDFETQIKSAQVRVQIEQPLFYATC